jgi:hypothetical protein
MVDQDPVVRTVGFQLGGGANPELTSPLHSTGIDLRGKAPTREDLSQVKRLMALGVVGFEDA